ncbi:MAG: sulfatase-like hydrolase/transferase [Gemmatimonadales bacterium]
MFTKAMATAPWTLPSHASLFTGRPPTELSAGWVTALDRAAPTLAEALSAAGYRTGGFVANYRYAGRSTGLARGFQRYDDYPIRWDEALRMTSLARRALRFPRVQQWLGEHRVLEARVAADVNDAFLDWVDAESAGPFFGFLNYVDAHSPYLPPAPFDSLWIKQEDRGQRSRRYTAAMDRAFGPGPMPADLVAEYLDGYDGAIRYLDGEIERLLQELARRGLLDDTIVVLTSDHGEHFGEHHLIQHGNSLFLPLLHVPLVVVWPGHVPEGVRVTAPTSLRNVAATVLDLTGAANPGLQGRSLAARWKPEGDGFGTDTVFAAVDWHESLSRFPPSPLLAGSLRSVVLDSLHLVARADGSEALFDPDRDFLERRNLAGLPAYQAELGRLRAALQAMTNGNPGPVPPK